MVDAGRAIFFGIWSCIAEIRSRMELGGKASVLKNAKAESVSRLRLKILTTPAIRTPNLARLRSVAAFSYSDQIWRDTAREK